MGIANPNKSRGITYTNLTNTGKIFGMNNVGGIAGCQKDTNIKNYENSGTVEGQNSVGGVIGNYVMDLNQENITLIGHIDYVKNSGMVIGESNVGGIFGYACMNNTSWWGKNAIWCTEFANLGEVEGKIENTVGEIVGNINSDGASTLTNYTVLGKITLNGKVLEGEYDVGSNTNLTLTDRKIHGAENIEATE